MISLFYFAMFINVKILIWKSEEHVANVQPRLNEIYSNKYITSIKYIKIFLRLLYFSYRYLRKNYLI